MNFDIWNYFCILLQLELFFLLFWKLWAAMDLLRWPVLNRKIFFLQLNKNIWQTCKPICNQAALFISPWHGFNFESKKLYFCFLGTYENEHYIWKQLTTGFKKSKKILQGNPFLPIYFLLLGNLQTALKLSVSES